MTGTGDQQEGGTIAIGIDLGTSWSCVGVYRHRHGRVEIIINEQGSRTTPSCVAFSDTESLLVGEAALNQAARNPTNTVSGAKRLPGRRFSDASVRSDMNLWPFKVVAGRGDKPMIAASHRRRQKLLAGEEIAAMLLVKIKRDAESYLGGTVTNAVVTVPVSFDVLQRRATKDAFAVAGLDVLGVVHEPVAAAVAYYGLFHESGTETKNVVVFDLGGGHTSAALLTISAGKIAVEATAGDAHLGGEDFDGRMVEHFVEQLKTEYGKEDVGRSARALVRLRAACEQAKRTLSSSTWAPIEIDCLLEGVDFRTTITRDQFEDLNTDLFCRCMEPVKKCLSDAKLDRSNVHDVVLVGGSTRIPCLRRMLRDLFDGKELLRKDINPEEAVARGAAILAAAVVSRVPDSDLLDLILSDTTPRSLGVEAAGGAMAVIIPKNSTIPIRREQIIALHSQEPTSVVIPVFEGENPIARENSLLGELKLSAVHRGTQRGGSERQVSVCFDIDADGVMTVNARDRATKNANQMKFMDKGQLSKQEIERMAEEAAEYMAQDAENRDRVNAKNLLEECLYVKRRKIEAERKKANDALSGLEQMIQQVDNDQVSSAKKFREDLEVLMVEGSTVAGKLGDA
ncbi:heat shock cognate 70 kDa protein [Brachypodium distachyon]|nr:heat shock cognate 70 kDa protein [Brachypodium distachyon]KQK09250.1 hypothetical protein BRADI_2g46937v3 [Brachypodium distachyon]|eukprot:XP_003567007.1 heat shock cognate 70 kDa protein [Brachypodium distachyon]